MRNILIDPRPRMLLNLLEINRHVGFVTSQNSELNVLTVMKAIPAIAFLIFLSCAGAYAQESEAIQQLKTVANSGDHDAARQLATAYAVGDGVAQDKEAANHWYSVAAKRQNTETVTQEEPAKEQRGFFPSPRATSTPINIFLNNKSSTATFLTQSELQAQVYSKGSRFNWQPSSSQPSYQQTVTAPSTWKKMTEAVSAAPAKTQQFLSDHSEEITDLAQFVIENYVLGSQSSGKTTSKSGSGKTAHPSK